MISLLVASVFMWCAIAGSVMLGVGAMRVTWADIGNGPPWNLEFVQIAAGGGAHGMSASFTLGLTIDGEIYAWGAANFLSLGIESDKVMSIQQSGNVLTPTLVSSNHRFSKIAAGGLHGLGLTVDGDLYAWGNNINGQLGVGDAIDRDVPTLVLGGHNFVQIVAGARHSLALTSCGDLYAWGIGGSIGDGSTENRYVPTLVSGNHEFVQISAGGTHSYNMNHSLGLTIGGELYAWGNNEWGQLGLGDTVNRTIPTRVPGREFSYVSAGGKYSLGLTADGELYMWGRIRSARDNTVENTLVPVLASDERFVQISAGESLNVGITTKGEVLVGGVYGMTFYAMSGFTPSLIAPHVLVLGNQGFVRIQAGYDQIMAFCGNGKIYGWGLNAFGEVGDGTTTRRTTPILIAVPPPPSIQDLLNQINQLRLQAQTDRDAIAALQKQLSDFMDEMRDALQGQGGRITALENRMTAVENDLEDLGEEIEKLQEAVDSIGDIEDRIYKMQGEIATMNRQGLVDMIEDLEELLEDLQKEIDDLDFLEDYDLNEIRAKIAALELALSNIDPDLDDKDFRTELQGIIEEILDAVLPSTLTVLEGRIMTVENEIQELLNDLDEIIAELLESMSPTGSTPRTGRNNEMLLYLGIAVLALGVVTMIVGTSVAVAAGRKRK